MAKVKNPLMSFTASGSIAGGAIQFRNTRSGPQVVLPQAGNTTRKPATTARQAAARAEFREIAAEWAAMPSLAKAFWQEVSTHTSAPNGWSAYLAARIKEMGSDPLNLLMPDGRPIVDAQGRRLTV